MFMSSSCKISNWSTINDYNVHFDKNPVYNKYSVIIAVLMTAAIHIFTTNAIYHDILNKYIWFCKVHDVP